MKKKVTVNEAALNVVGVSIKVIQIGKKQMTLSVFRQLPNEPVWDSEQLRPRGQVWGRVNYFWDKCGCFSQIELGDRTLYGLARDPTHIVWQLGAELRRSCLTSMFGEAKNGYPLAQAPPEDPSRRYQPHRVEAQAASNRAAHALREFYAQHVEAAEQLFIAV